MSCCGQKRAAVAASYQTAQQPTPSRSFNPEPGDRPVRYLGAQPLSLTGPLSGRIYYFAESGITSLVDDKDIEALLRTGLFARDTGSPIPA